jgi:sugar/nucleoside kinase (ribokinase family)
MANVLIVGSIALDTVETPYGKRDDLLGGAATYSSCAASLLAPVRLVGVVGEDFPQQHLDFLAGRGVDLTGVQRIPGGKSFRWAGRYEGDLGHAITLDTQLNVFEQFQPQLPPSYRASDIVFLANIHPALQRAVLDQCERPRLTMADTMNLWLDTALEDVREVLSRVDLALMNDAEARQLTGEPQLPAAARKVLELGPSFVVIKRGAHGSYLAWADGCFCAPGYPVPVVRDTTGAGDSFAGGLAGFLASRDSTEVEDLRRGVVVGSALASFTVEDFGLTRLAAATREELRERFETIRELTRFGAWEEG